MQHAKPQSEKPVLFAIPYDTYAQATCGSDKKSREHALKFYDGGDLRQPLGEPGAYLLFTGAGDPSNTPTAEKTHAERLSDASDVFEQLSRENQRLITQNGSSFPLTVSWNQGHRVRMMASMIKADSSEALQAQLPNAKVEVMDSVKHLQNACDSLQVQQQLGVLHVGERVRGR